MITKNCYKLDRTICRRSNITERFFFYLYTTKTPLAYIAQLHSHSAMLHNRIVTPFTAYKLMGERAHSHHRSRHLDPLGINCRSIAQFKLRGNFK
ncbi:putative odorant receptor 69a, isoform [Dirofilaria immitis]